MAEIGQGTRVETTVIMAEAEIRRALWRMAHQIIERLKGTDGLCFVGIPTRGLPLAQRLATIVKELEEREIPVASLDIGPYRDDLPHKMKALPKGPSLNIKVDDKNVIVVDDVLFTGRSARAALDALTHAGRPRNALNRRPHEGPDP